MKLNALAALSLATLVSCVSVPGPEASAPAAPAGPVRKERVEEYRVPVVVKETIAFADGVVERVVSYDYLDGYRLLASTVARKPSVAAPVERVEYVYAGGALASKTAFGSDGAPVARSDYAYDADGRLVREAIADGKGRPQSVSELSWADGRKSSWRVLSPEGLVLGRTEYFYDGELLVLARLYDGSGRSSGRIEYVYGEADRLEAVRYYTGADVQDGRTEYLWKDGLMVSESVFRASGRLERRLDYEYGPDGEVVRKTLYDASGRARETTAYQYAYRTESRVVIYYE